MGAVPAQHSTIGRLRLAPPRCAIRTRSPTPPTFITSSGKRQAATCARRMRFMRIERAILSVSDKTGIVELARALRAKDVEILSTGGTAKHLADNGIEVTSIAQWSGAPEILGGRVKTLTPKVFGAILHDRDNAAHRDDVTRLGIPAIDLVVVNL